MPLSLSFSTDKNNIGILTLYREDKEFNTVDSVFLTEFNQCLDNIQMQKDLQGVIICSAREDFMVGADIYELHSFQSAEDGRKASQEMNRTMNRLASLTLPVVAVIHGNCLGSGLELALACTWRLVSDTKETRLGHPEIQLGLIPGAGGTRRLPRTIGLQAAIDMILTGRRISGKKAQKNGLADACIPHQLLFSQAKKYLLKEPGKKPYSASSQSGNLSKDLPKWAIEGNPIGRKVMFRKSRDLVDEKTRGFYPASYKALEAVFDGYDLSLDESCALESRLFGELVQTRQSQSLMHLFHAQANAKRHPWIGEASRRFGQDQMNLIGVIGAGLMGSGISTICADHDIRVRLADESEEALGRSLKYVHTFLSRKVDRRRLQPFELYRKMAFISPSLSTQGLESADMVIEAVHEDQKIKQFIAQDITHRGHKNLIFASNTSAIPISKIAEKSKYPDQVIGMHFFSPVEKMPLLEIVITEKTAPWVVDRCLQLGKLLDKKIILVKDAPGFYTTRTLAFYLSEAMTIVSEGTPVDVVDHALTQFGFPQGPVTLIDEVGLDICIPVIKTMTQAFPDKISLPEGLEHIYASGRLGKKNGKGFYLYKDGEKAGVDPDADRLVRKGKSERVVLPADEVIERCLMIFVNESVLCLEEDILTKASDGDLGAVFGLGFPPFWGGPFKYCDFVGIHHVVEVLNRLSEKYGDRFKPARLLKEYAVDGKKFFPNEPWQYARH